MSWSPSLGASNGNDSFSGTDLPDDPSGLEGNDTLAGQAGADTLAGGPGDDLLLGGADADRLDGTSGADTLVGGAGNDTLISPDGQGLADYSGNLADQAIVAHLFGRIRGDEPLPTPLPPNPGDPVPPPPDPTPPPPAAEFTGEVADGSGGTDELYGIRHIRGGAGNDFILSELGGSVTLDGGGGDDTLRSLASFGGDAMLLGGSGDDLLRGRDGNDTLRGGEGDDSLDGEGREDTLEGGEGNDTLNGGTFSGDGADSLEGGNGNDSLDGGDAGGDTLIGGAGDDTLRSGAFVGASLFEGGEGNDSILSEAFFAFGGLGSTLDGGAGDDTLSTGSAGIGLVWGGEGNDSLSGGSSADTLEGGNGNDSLDGDDFGDSLLGGAGDDSLDGDGWRDTLDGGEGNDTLNGGDFSGDSADLLRGGNGNDSLDGDDGDDTLMGGAGDDTLLSSGAFDNRVLDGGDGDDLVIWRNFFGNDTVTLGTGTNRLELPGWESAVPVEEGTRMDGWTVAFNGNAATFSRDFARVTVTDWTGEGSGTNSVICFYPGTLIATPDGPRAVETLAPGEQVLTAGGEPRAIRWMGRQTVSTRFADPLRVLPIRIAAGALGEGLPRRDLLLSPCHALLLDGVLVQAGALVNGRTITRVAAVPEVFTYHHVELATHELILAEGVPAETFLDNTERLAFDNWAEHEALHGDLPPIAEMDLPRAASARQVPAATRRRLAAIAAAGAGRNAA